MGMQRGAESQGSPGAVGSAEAIRKDAPTKEIDAHVGSRLRARRMELALSQAVLGRQLGLTFSQVQKYENGSNRIAAARLYQLAALLGVPVQYFFEGLVGPRRDLESRSAAIVSDEGERFQEAVIRISDPHARRALLALASTLVTPN